MEATLPADLQAGSYTLTVTKTNFPGTELSSTGIHFLVKPEVAIDNLQCEGQHLTLTGSGFGSYLDAEDSGTALLADGEKCTIESWNENRIAARCSSGATKRITVNSIFGNATIESGCRFERPRWWSIWSWWASWSWARRSTARSGRAAASSRFCACQDSVPRDGWPHPYGWNNLPPSPPNGLSGSRSTVRKNS